MSDYVPSETGAGYRRYSRRLVNRHPPIEEPMLTTISEVFSPVRPFGELFTPSPRRRSSIHLQFTPMINTGEKGRRSFVPVTLPFSNRALVIGVSIFLLVSGVYKSGLVSWIIAVRTSLQISPVVPLPEGFQISTSASVMEKIDTYPSKVFVETESDSNLAVSTSATVPNIPELAEYETNPRTHVTVEIYDRSLLEVARLLAMVSDSKTEESFFKNKCFSNDRVSEEQISLLRVTLDQCSGDLATVVRIEQTCAADLTAHKTRHESELKELQSELVVRFNDELSLRNAVIQNLGLRVEDLERENSNLNTRISFEATLAVPVEMPPTQEPPAVGDRSLVQSAVLVFVLTVLVTVLSIVSLVLWAGRNPPAVREESFDAEEMHAEQMAMALEEQRGELMRESEAAMSKLRQQHQRELFRLNAVIRETQIVNAELDIIVKEVISDISTRTSSPRNNDFEIWQYRPEEGSEESSSLGSSLTPIRIPLSTCTPPITVVASPVRFSIASPRRGTDDCSDTSEEQENVQENIASIYDNFKQ